jgi:peroxiredoxin Q/BCP
MLHVIAEFALPVIGIVYRFTRGITPAVKAVFTAWQQTVDLPTLIRTERRQPSTVIEYDNEGVIGEMGMVEEGDMAPDFELEADDGSTVKLSQYRGKEVVLYFYPKDGSSGCTKEACDFRDSVSWFDKMGIVVLGISKDGMESHRKFKAKNNLNFPLLSDPDVEVHKKYGVWKEKSMYGRKFMGAERTTFLIGEDGKVKKIFRKVKVPGHVETVKSSF